MQLLFIDRHHRCWWWCWSQVPWQRSHLNAQGRLHSCTAVTAAQLPQLATAATAAKAAIAAQLHSCTATQLHSCTAAQLATLYMMMFTRHDDGWLYPDLDNCQCFWDCANGSPVNRQTINISMLITASEIFCHFVSLSCLVSMEQKRREEKVRSRTDLANYNSVFLSLCLTIKRQGRVHLCFIKTF